VKCCALLVSNEKIWHFQCINHHFKSNLADLLKKRKKVTLEKYLRIPTVQFLFRYALLQRYFTGTEKSAFQAKLAKIGQFFVYNFAKKMKIEISKKLTT